MHKIAKFEKVSFERFKEDWMKYCPYSKTVWTDEELREIYDKIELPRRATSGSAGYDIYSPCEIRIAYDTAKVIPTGIRCKIEEGWFLDLNPRSGLGFRSGMRLANTRGIIDSDYYNADNEGHILVKLTHDSCVGRSTLLVIEEGQAFCQGIFEVYGITEDDEPVRNNRTNGFGSTDKN